MMSLNAHWPTCACARATAKDVGWDGRIEMQRVASAYATKNKKQLGYSASLLAVAPCTNDCNLAILVHNNTIKFNFLPFATYRIKLKLPVNYCASHILYNCFPLWTINKISAICNYGAGQVGWGPKSLSTGLSVPDSAY